MPDTIRIAAHAKVNLFLRVLSQETSGFHGIETLFGLLELADDITVDRTPSGIELDVVGADTGPADENLAVRAAQEVLRATGERFGVRIKIVKRIPVQAGLGGGSSDAAATLHAVNTLAANAVPPHEILQYAARLGSDIPFLTTGAPLALAWNRGERLFRVPAPKPAPVLLAIPPVGVSTADAYAMLDRAQGDPAPRGAVVLENDALRSWGTIARLGGNDFESVVASEHPQIGELFERVARTSPLLARMSGSGSAIVGVYRSEADLDHAASAIGQSGQQLIKTMTRSQAAPGPVAGDRADV